MKCCTDCSGLYIIEPVVGFELGTWTQVLLVIDKSESTKSSVPYLDGKLTDKTSPHRKAHCITDYTMHVFLNVNIKKRYHVHVNLRVELQLVMSWMCCGQNYINLLANREFNSAN